MDDLLFSPSRWRPLSRPAAAETPVPVIRRDAAVHCGTIRDEGPQILSCAGPHALVRFRHYAQGADAVALQANGWWMPDPVDGCDLLPTADGWWEGTFEVPADWRTSYGFAVHEGPGDPPWWRGGLKRPGTDVVADRGARCAHRAARGGEPRSMLTLPDDGPFGYDQSTQEPAPVLHPLEDAGLDEQVRWWASRPGDPGCEHLHSGEPLPLLVVTDGAQHADLLDTPLRLRRGVAAGVLPPLAAVFIDSGPRRAEVLGVPGGHARWIGRTLVPRLLAEGLRDPCGETAPVSVTRTPSRVVVTGSSFGGLTALFAVARAPRVLGAAIAQSVSLWRYPDGALVEPLLGAVRDAERVGAPLRLRLHAGRYEGTMPASASALLEELRSRAAAEQLAPDAGLEVHSGGHDWAWWQPAMLHTLSAILR